jgi:hypothetical protein
LYRVAEDQQMPAAAEHVIDCVEVQREETGVVAAHPHLDDLAAEERGHGEERHVRGRGQDDGGSGCEKYVIAICSALITSGTCRIRAGSTAQP